MTEEESVRRFHVICGGRVYGPYGPYVGSVAVRPHWLWVADADDADRVAALLFPHLSEWRRARVYELFPDVVGEAVAA